MRSRDSTTDVRFASLPISDQTKRALQDMQYATCTVVQAATLPVCLSGVDVVCKARTGTGKTLAFLIPAVEQVLKRGPTTDAIKILVLSPTRELAHQIAAEAHKLIKHHTLTVESVVGGTNAAGDARRLAAKTPDILVATPGRLIDLLETTRLKQQLRGIQTLVFDEADRLLDMGFRPAINQILGMLPPKVQRQTMLFSATYPTDIQQLCKTALRPEHQLVDTVGETEVQTAEKIKQWVVVCTMESQIAHLVHMLRRHQAEDPNYKVMVFFTTARLTGLYAEMFNHLGMPVLELHSRKSQAHRTRVAEKFRNSDGTVLFSSDVSARGVDYPDVSLVMQVGLPADRDQYIHRVGRTARAGKQGQAVLLLQDFEQQFLGKLQGLPVKLAPALPQQEVNQYGPSVDLAVSKLSDQSICQAYQAWLGFYKTHVKLLRWSPADVISWANNFAEGVLGCAEPPAISAKVVGKMGLKGMPGLKVIPGSNPEMPPLQRTRQAPRPNRQVPLAPLGGQQAVPRGAEPLPSDTNNRPGQAKRQKRRRTAALRREAESLHHAAN